MFTDTPLEEMELSCGVITVDDSDYYTPDDPPATVLSPLHSAEKVSINSNIPTYVHIPFTTVKESTQFLI